MTATRPEAMPSSPLDVALQRVRRAAREVLHGTARPSLGLYAMLIELFVNTRAALDGVRERLPPDEQRVADGLRRSADAGTWGAARPEAGRARP
jgi:hypothetical protein